MKLLLHLIHASPTVRPLYEAAFHALELDVDLVTVLPPAAAGGALSSAYAELATSWAHEGLTVAQGLLRDYPGPSGSYHGWFLASWSAGYKLIERALAQEDAHAIDGVVLLDSGHAALDPDGTASDAQIAPFVAHAQRAIERQALLWAAHTDVPTPQKGPGAFASTTQFAKELLRLAGVQGAPPRAPDAVTVGLLHVQAFDREPPARARQEHVGALLSTGPSFTAQAIRAWVTRDDVAPALRAVTPAEHALLLAIAEIGVSEDPPGSNTGAKVRLYLSGCERGGRHLRLGAAPWCAAFVGWVDFCAGISRSWRASVAELVADAREAGTWEPIGGYVPMAGDLVVLRRDGQDPTLGGSGHVGRVERVEGDQVWSVDGNVGGHVVRIARPLSDPEIVGFIRTPGPMADVPSTEALAVGSVAAGLDRAARETLDW